MYRTIFRYGHILCVSLCNFLFNTFWFIAKYIERGKADHKSQANASDFNVNHSQEDDQVVSKSSMDFDSDAATGKESSNLSFSFLYQESKDFQENIAETEDSAFLQTAFSASLLKYQFIAGKNVKGFIEEPETISFTIQEMFVDSTDGLIMNGQITDGRVLQNEDEKKIDSQEEVQEFFRGSNASSNRDGFFVESGFCTSDDVEEFTMEKETPEQERAEYSVETAYREEILGETEASNSAQNKIPTDEVRDDDISYEVQLLPGNEFSASDLKPELKNSDVGLFTGDQEVQSGIVEVLSSDAKAYEIFASATPMISDERQPEIIERSSSPKEIINGDANVDKDTEEDIEDDYIELDPSSNDANQVNEGSLSQKGKNLFEVAYTGGQDTTLMEEGSQGLQEESLVKESWGSHSDDQDEFDILLEHQQLVKQMKMERKNSKVRGLPTISEEEECHTLEDFKPLKIDEKFEYKDLMEEIFKFYKSYAEKMRKLDILNYQTFHAISFLQLKDSQTFMPSKRSPISSIKAFSLSSFSLFKQRRIHADPIHKSITEMHRHLELVYVGQICLSWEILHWQYGKVKELLQHDSQDYLSYNQIAGEYQQFQVVMQRFLEDELFQGPRIQNYVKSRSFCCSLLQIPIIKDDCPKDKKEMIGEEKDAISISLLVETIEDSMRIFWEFLLADKEEANGILKKNVQGSLVDLQAHADSELLMNVRTCLEKKERKIKEIQRSGNCIVKKFQKHQAIQPSNALLISQVELKLVARVLSLSRLTTDQLIWCQKKLNNINIVNMRIRIEPEFLLFPC